MINSFPERLKIARLAKKLSQAKLGELADLKATIICTYEKGKRSPSINKMIQLATILDVNPGWLVGEPEKNVKGLKINPQEMILELRERIKDKDNMVKELMNSAENRNSLIQSLREENENLRKGLNSGTGEKLAKNG